MIPWCGRLRNGRLDFDGEVHEFPLTSPPHANHGRAHLQAWRSVDGREAQNLGAEHHIGTTEIETDLDAPWPFGARVSQRFDLDDDSLTVTAQVTATEVAMPAMIGWHPWFKRELDRGGSAELTVDTTAASVYATDDEDIPTGELMAVPTGPWNACFVGLNEAPRIDWPGALTLSISSTFDHWVIFTEPEHALCVEPQSGPPNQFHLRPHVLRPGETLSGSMTLRWA